MAIQYICDGCGAPLDDGMQEFGWVIKTQYCGRCADIIAPFIAKKDDLHTKLAKRWKSGRNILREAARRALGPNARLPDE